MSAPITKEVFRVDPARLASGIWCPTRDKMIGEGDIHASYSADKIGMEGKVRKPFVWRNTLWVCTGTLIQDSVRSAEAYRLIPTRFFNGETTSYHEVASLEPAERFKPEGFYHGMQVRHGKLDYVLVGPSATFAPKDESETLKQANLFDAL